MNDHIEQRPERIDQQMALASQHLLATIKFAPYHFLATWPLVIGIATCIELSILSFALRRGDHDYNQIDGASQTNSPVGIIAWLPITSSTFGATISCLAVEYISFGATDIPVYLTVIGFVPR